VVRSPPPTRSGRGVGDEWTDRNDVYSSFDGFSELVVFNFSRPLHEAVENGDVHLVRLLLSYGADPHLATYSGQSPLSLATDKQTRMLLEHHVNDVQGYGSASVWNFDDSTLTRKYI